MGPNQGQSLGPTVGLWLILEPKLRPNYRESKTEKDGLKNRTNFGIQGEKLEPQMVP